jgi:hypothetical protein
VHEQAYIKELSKPANIATINSGKIHRETFAVVSSLIVFPDFSNKGIRIIKVTNKTPKITKTDM